LYYFLLSIIYKTKSAVRDKLTRGFVTYPAKEARKSAEAQYQLRELENTATMATANAIYVC
jgi:hypothetical protein